MASLKAVKGKMRSIAKIRQVTKAMEAVSAVKMRKSQKAAFEARPYAQSALSILKRLAKSEEIQSHPLLVHRTNTQKTAILLVTSDRGLAGALNGNVLRRTHLLIKELELKKESVLFFCIGRRGAEHFERRGYNIERVFDGWGEGASTERTEELARDLILRFEQENFDTLHIVYTNFLSSFAQEPVARLALPIEEQALSEMVSAITPTEGMYAEVAEEVKSPEYLFEPSASGVLEQLVPFLLSIELYHAVLEANASEHSARMVAMKNASDRAKDMGRELNLEFNKQRQSAITAEISEITSGIEAMA